MIDLVVERLGNFFLKVSYSFQDYNCPAPLPSNENDSASGTKIKGHNEVQMSPHFLKKKEIIFLFKEDLLFVITSVIDVVNTLPIKFHKNLDCS